MHCYVLCYHQEAFDTQVLSHALSASSNYVEVGSVSTLNELKTHLESKAYDLLIVAKPFELTADLSELLAPSLPVLVITPQADAQASGCGTVVAIEPTSTLNIARMVALLIQGRRAQSQLDNVGSHIKELTVTLEYNKEEGFHFASANDAFFKNEGIKKEALLGKKINQVDLLFDIALLEENIYEVYESGDALNMPSFFYMKEGRREWLDLFIFKSNRGEITLVGVPLSELKRAHDKVEESKRYLQTLLNAQAHMIYITDGQTLINANRAFLDYFGCETLHAFKKSFGHVNDIFEVSQEPGYLSGENENWLECVASEPEVIHKARVPNQERAGVFVPSVQIIEVEEKKQYVVVLTDITELESEKEKLRVVAMTDTLTGIANRFKFNSIIEEQMAMSHRYNTALSIVMLDIDHFKRVNDDFSHQTGDTVLKTFAQLIDAQLRGSDLFVRWGGEEFLILLTNTTLENAHFTAEKLRLVILNHTFAEVGTVTSSFGVSTLQPNDTLSSLIARADEALYQAKRAGRNRTQLL